MLALSLFTHSSFNEPVGADTNNVVLGVKAFLSMCVVNFIDKFIVSSSLACFIMLSGYPIVSLW